MRVAPGGVDRALTGSGPQAGVTPGLPPRMSLMAWCQSPQSSVDPVDRKGLLPSPVRGNSP